MKKVFMLAEVSLLLFLWLMLSVCSWLKPPGQSSDAERRPLAQMPELTVQSMANSSFMQNFDTYTLDQFPGRDLFRRIKAQSAYRLFGRQDNNGIYFANGHAAKLEYPLNNASVSNACEKITAVYDEFFSQSDARVYLSIVPDKGYFLAEPNGFPAMDYAELVRAMQENLSFAEYIDIFPTLAQSSYYRTDSHWMQDQLLLTAKTLADAMGTQWEKDYQTVTAKEDFLGVYASQSALKMEPDTLKYLTNDMLDACTVYNAETGKTTGIYNLEKVNAKDPYDIFLSGAAPLLTIENPSVRNGKQLVVFRDSFGSSLLPLLVAGYESIIVVDTRYIAPSYLPNFADLSAADDVLFLYSTSLLNSSSTLK